MSEKTKVTGVRLTADERKALRKVGNGNLTDAIKQGIELLLKKHNIKLTN